MDDLIRDFIAETREGIEALDSQLVRFEQEPENPELLGEVFRLIHTIKGTCGFIGLSRLQGVAHAAETVLGGFRDGSVQVNSEAVSAVLEAVDLIRVIIEGLAQTGAEPAGDDRALVQRLDAASQPPEASNAPVPAAADRPSATASLLERAGGEASLDAACEMLVTTLSSDHVLAAADPDHLQGALRDGLCAAARGFADRAHFNGLQTFLGAPPTADLVRGLLETLGAHLAALDVADDAIAELQGLISLPADPTPVADLAPAAVVNATPPTNAPPAASEAKTTAEPDAAGQTIRVSVDALEHLMTVASELVLIRNQLLQLLRLEPESPFAAPLHRLNQVASELQEGVMTTRMQPINGAWAKLPRLVRDLARDLGKKIDLALFGQETELDRQVLELIKDPLTHMIRNAADHGLEGPEERRAAGKSETGRITLSARHEGGAIVIEMSDDGRGLSATRIRAKAVSSGVITAQQAEGLSDADARHLIFLPGFSTAAEVTAVSGRGVGMDVVRTNIEKIGGAIELVSTEGRGTQFTIRIPLTLTIISALTVECCGERFAMPQSSVIELVSANDASGRTIEHIGGQAVLRLRDRLLPLVSLQTLLDLPGDGGRGETCIVVAKVGAFTFGVIVDRVFDTEEIVVKPTASVLRHLKLYSGATILGDGSVIMILDFNGMSLEAGAGRASAAQDEFDATCVEDHAERTALLVFRAADGALKAAPLAAVSRIEEIDPVQVERVDGRSVLQYRGRLMPVIGCDGAVVEPAGLDGSRPLLVFSRDDRAIGLMVEEIVDIVETVVAADLKSSGDGAAGSLIITGRATALIDVDYFWRRAFDEEEPAAAAADAEPPRPTKRLLVVDQSPFCQMLLRPLLASAGYNVTVAVDPDAALALHNADERFDLIMADTAGPNSRRLAEAFDRATHWHTTPLLGLALHRPGKDIFDETTVLNAVSAELRGAA